MYIYMGAVPIQIVPTSNISLPSAAFVNPFELVQGQRLLTFGWRGKSPAAPSALSSPPVLPFWLLDSRSPLAVVEAAVCRCNSPDGVWCPRTANWFSP